MPPKEKELELKKEKLSAFHDQKGQLVKPFRVEDIYGNIFNSDELKGKTLVLNFWFIACPPCLKEIPELNKLVNDYSDKNVVFIAFALDTKKKLGTFLGKTSFDFKIIPNSFEFSKLFLVQGYPSHIVINKKGIISYTGIGLEDDTILKIKTAIDESLTLF